MITVNKRGFDGNAYFKLTKHEFLNLLKKPTIKVLPKVDRSIVRQLVRE